MASTYFAFSASNCSRTPSASSSNIVFPEVAVSDTTAS